ncbi:hypothetical protein HPB52_024653 [Rhipicephalus sanguineus]|uniref:Uncharacterized protein n=1 Tax=Rhipicephalus sanguineus TaxID=34632 RepID=A0A9D4TE08_RHISA|nr:hypothetical protein HPB52_024653 [Rhipicephalus sanguineus]
MNGKMFPPVSHAAFSVGASTSRAPDRARREIPPPNDTSHRPRRQSSLPRRTFPARQDPPIYVCMVLRGHQAERHDIPRLGSTGRVKTAQGSLLYLHPNSPSNFTTPIFTNPIRPASPEKKSRPDESPAQL